MSVISNLLNVLVYYGPGVCEFSFQQTLRTLRQFLRNSFDVRQVSLEELGNPETPWDENCALFVLPGGRDLHYLRDFSGNSIIERIKNAMSLKNMKFLGICAGAYFASDRVEFEVGRQYYEVIGDRPLKLTSACARGTINGRFYYSGDSGGDCMSLQAVPVQAPREEFPVAYNGGCYYNMQAVPREDVYGTYDSERCAILLTDSYCLSGVHFEYDPLHSLQMSAQEGDRKVFTDLLKYDAKRRQLIFEILARLQLTPLHPDEQHPTELKEIRLFAFNVSEKLRFEKHPQIFVQRNLDSSPSFDSELFYQNLPSALNSMALLYSPVVTSTQTILKEESNLCDQLPHFTPLLADHQMSGLGRRGNSWVSSPACLQFTLLLHYPTAKGTMSSLQFLMAVALAETCNSLSFKSSNVRPFIKWPNDVYLAKSTTSPSGEIIGKLSGILVNSSNSVNNRGVNQVLIGVGVNLLSDSNLPHLTHLNDYLTEPVRKEVFFAEVLGRFHHLYNNLLENDVFPFEEYHRNWLHSGQIVEAEGRQVRIRGIDLYGYLEAEDLETGDVLRFEPDGNSFDMMRNLIHRK